MQSDGVVDNVFAPELFVRGQKHRKRLNICLLLSIPPLNLISLYFSIFQ